MFRPHVSFRTIPLHYEQRWSCSNRVVLAMESLIRLRSHVHPFSLEGQTYQGSVWFQENPTVT